MHRNVFQLIISLVILLPVTASAKNYWLGPAGGTGGNYFTKTVASHERVCGVYVRHGARIDAVQLKICDSYGNSYRSQRFGGSGGTESFFAISSKEYLKAIAVYPGVRNGGNRVFGLQLIKSPIGSSSSTTEVRSPLYGTAVGRTQYRDGSYYLRTDPMPLGSPGIIGIWGRAADELDAIGVVVSQSQVDNSPGMPLINSVGGQGGFNFGSWVFQGKLCRIDIHYATQVKGLRFKDCKTDGTSNYTPWYGGTDGSLSNFTLQSNEYLKAIKGSLITRDSKVIFSSVYFVTNLRTSPVYGSTTTRTFSIDFPDGQSPDAIQTRTDNYINNLRFWIN